MFIARTSGVTSSICWSRQTKRCTVSSVKGLYSMPISLWRVIRQRHEKLALTLSFLRAISRSGGVAGGLQKRPRRRRKLFSHLSSIREFYTERSWRRIYFSSLTPVNQKWTSGCVRRVILRSFIQALRAPDNRREIRHLHQRRLNSLIFVASGLWSLAVELDIQAREQLWRGFYWTKHNEKQHLCSYCHHLSLIPSIYKSLFISLSVCSL